MRHLSLSINGTPIAAPSTIPTGGLDTSGQNMISLGINLLFIGGIIFALVFLIFGGVMWIMSGGDKQKLQAARTQVIYSIFGLVVIFLAVLAVNVIGYFFGVDLLKFVKF